MTSIQATGTSESRHQAEEATILARISAESRDRAASIAEATRLHNDIVARALQLREAGDADWHSAEPPSTWTHKNYPDGNVSSAVVEHVTSSSVQITLVNLELVAGLVSELAEGGAETSVSWSLSEATRREHERSARKVAVGVAREVADDYAQALGERIVEVVSISDSAAVTPFGAADARLSFAASAEVAEVTVPEITISASIQGVFRSE